MDLISVIVTCYNSEKYIEACLKSLQKQTYTNFEAIVVNDGSIDNSLPIIKETVSNDKRFKIIDNEHVGFPEAKNIGLKNVSGDYIIFLDSDDLVNITWLEQLYFTAKITNADITTCYYKDFKDEKELDLSKRYPGLLLQEYIDLKMLLIFDARCFSLMWNKLVRKELYSDIHFEDQIALSDMSVMYKVFDKANKVVQIKNLLIYHRYHDESMSKTTQNPKTEQEKIDYWLFRFNLTKKISKFIFDNYPLSRYQIQNVLATEFSRAKKLLGDKFKLLDLSDIEYIMKANVVKVVI